jgi:DNA repair exonuclease SbcCD ATPase subunit
MSEIPEDKNQKKSNKRALIIAIIAIFVIINGVKLYMDYQKQEELESEIASKDAELEDTYHKLENISNELNQKIEEIQKLGGDIEELTKVKEELEKEKTQLRAAQTTANRRYREIKDKLDGYETLLKQQDVEITRLKDINKELVSENTNLKKRENKLTDSLSTVSQSRQQLAEKVALASRLKAENIKIFAVNNKGKERENEFRNRHIDKIKIEFNLAENKVAPIEGKDIIIRIVDSEGDVLFDVASGAGTFIVGGKELFFTARQEILFDNTQQRLSFLYHKGSEYKDGKYTIEIYADDYVIGRESFIVK